MKQVLLPVYCETKVFFPIHLFTMLLLFYVFEVGKAKGPTQSVLMILILNGLFITLGISRQNKASPLETPHNCDTPFINFQTNQDERWQLMSKLVQFTGAFSWSNPKFLWQLKVCVHYFLSHFYFFTKWQPFKNYENAFYFI